jgi:hypothetical protein
MICSDILWWKKFCFLNKAFLFHMRTYRDGVDDEVALSNKKNAIALLSKQVFLCQNSPMSSAKKYLPSPETSTITQH